MLRLVVLFLFIGSISAQCGNPDVFPKLDVSKYVGKWYEIQRFKFVLEEDLRCITAEYSVIDSTHIKVNNSGIEVPSGKFNSQIGEGIVNDPSVPSKLTIEFFGFVKSPYWVIDTDYTYTLIYSCSTFFGVSLEYAWILSRQPTLDDATVTKLKNKLASYKIDISKFEKTDQTNCWKN